MKGKHRFHPIECLPLTAWNSYLYKNSKRQCHAILCTVSNTGPDSKLKLTALWHFKPFIHLWIVPSGLKQ